MSGAISQSGPAVVGHVPVFIGNGTVQDAGPADGGFITQFGITNDGLLAFGINTGLITGPYTQFGAQVSSDGTVTLSAQSFNGGPSANVVWDINGVQYPLNPTGNGNISGPVISVDGDLLSFNGTNGNLVQDSGIPSARVVRGPTPTTIGHLAAFNNTVGTLLEDSGVSIASLVTGPGASVDDNIVLFNGTGGNVLEDSGVGLASLVPVTSSKLIPPIANITALQAATTGTLPQGVCYVEGYYALNDGGEGTFATGTPTTANGGTIINDASARSWYRLGSRNGATIFQFGAKGDGATDDWGAWQAAINAVQGTSAVLFFPACVSVVSLQLTVTAAIKIVGAGNGSGPGIMTTAGASVLLCKSTFTSGDVINCTTFYACIFRDFQIAGALGLGFTDVCPRVTGAGIHLAGPTGHVNSNSVIDNIATSGMVIGIYLERCAENTITNGCYHQAWGERGFYADNGNTAVESSCGHVTRNQYFGNLSGAQIAGMEIHCGYGDITGNKFLGAQFGLKVIADQTVNIGSVMMALNSFEENTVQSLFVTTTGPIISSVQIVTNQFSNIAALTLTGHIVVQPTIGGGGNELYDIDITGNNFNTQTTAGGAAFIFVNLINGTVTRNRGRLIGGAAYGIVAEVGDDQTLQILDNEWSSSGGTLTGTTGYLIQGAPVVRDLATRAFTVALLPSTPADGSQIYATDGHATNLAAQNFTVTTSGAGCIAQREGGEWLTIRS